MNCSVWKIAGLRVALLACKEALAWSHASSYGHSSGGAGSWNHCGQDGSASGSGGICSASSTRGGGASGGSGSWSGKTESGGSTSGGEGAWHGTGAQGGTASGGEGAWHAQGKYGASAAGYHADDAGTTVYHPATYGTSYHHPPTAVYASSGCYNCAETEGVNPAAAAAAVMAAGAAIARAADRNANANSTVIASDRRTMVPSVHRFFIVAVLLVCSAGAYAEPLPSWNDGAAKRAILHFVQATTTAGGAEFVPREERIATFDQDGTLWVEQPVYALLMYCLDQVPALVKATPALAEVEPFKTVLSGHRDALARLTLPDIVKIAAATLSGMSEEAFEAQASAWLATARDPRWKRPYTELVYLPMQELLGYLRENGYKTYIVTGGGQDFTRVYSEQVYGIPNEQVIGTAGTTSFEYDVNGRPQLIKQPKLLLNNNDAGKPEGIQLMIGRRPRAAFGNSSGDTQMLEYASAGNGAHLAMLLLHDDKEREYAYGPAQGLPDSKVGTFPQALYDQAEKQGWTVIKMKSDWKRVFSFEP